MKRYAAPSRLWCRTISPSCSAHLDVTGLDAAGIERKVRDSGWKLAPPDANRHMSPDAGKYVCRACAERAGIA